MTHSKGRATYWILLALYYRIKRSRSYYYFLVVFRGREFANEFREKQRNPQKPF